MRENVGGTHQLQGERSEGFGRLVRHPGLSPDPHGEPIVRGLLVTPVAPVNGRALPRQAGVYDRHPVGQHRFELTQEQHGGQATADEDQVVLSNSHPGDHSTPHRRPVIHPSWCWIREDEKIHQGR